MDYYVKPVDDLSRLINDKASELYEILKALPLEKFDFSDFVKNYFTSHHKSRTFFSVQTAAELLYRSIKHTKKNCEEIVVMDYGAGVGSLYLLAKIIGCKTVIYNDIVGEMTDAAKAVAEYLDISIDLYITADHIGTLELLKEKNISCDIILSRNVVEHIYDLNDFYDKMSAGEPKALIYFSTTANYHNPAMLWYHKMLHKKAEKIHLQKRREIIISKAKQLNDEEIEALALATRGLAMSDLYLAIEQYKFNKDLPNPSIHYTNTCDPDSGIWSEHILPIKDYKQIIETKGYKLTVLPAFWDTHYSSKLKSIFGKTMNVITGILGNKGGLRTTAFIYIIAEKK